jgi:hypothetical protein
VNPRSAWRTLKTSLFCSQFWKIFCLQFATKNQE